VAAAVPRGRWRRPGLSAEALAPVPSQLGALDWVFDWALDWGGSAPSADEVWGPFCAILVMMPPARSGGIVAKF
jgi:hypothetical protein